MGSPWLGGPWASSSIVRAQSPRAVLFCDSMTDWYHLGGGTLSTAIYDSTTGFLTLTFSSAHFLYNNVMARIWHYGYTALRDQAYVPLQWVSTTVVRAQMGALPGVPDATNIATGLFPYVDNARAAASFVNWIQMTQGWTINVVRNAAQSGDTSAGGLRRLQRDILSYSPTIVIGQMLGINDLNANIGFGLSETEVIANNQLLFDGIVNSGATLCVATMTPVSSAEAARALMPNMQYVLRMNDWLRDYARSNYQSVNVIDHYKSFADVASSTGLALASRVRNDGIHWATKTCRIAVRDWISVVQKIFPQSETTLPKTLIDTHPNSRLTLSGPASATSGVVTVPTTNNRYRVGEEFRALGGSQALANGWFTVATAGTSSFTYLAPGVPDGTVTGLLVSRSRGLFVNPLLQTTTGGATLGAGITRPDLATTAPLGLSANSGIGAITALAYVEAAVNVGANALGYNLPVAGNEFRLEISQADLGARPQFSTSGTTAFATQMLPNRSYIFQCILRLQSTNWALTPIRQLLANFDATMDTGSVAAPAIIAQDTTETSAYAEDMRLHIRTPVLKTNIGATVSNATFLIAATSELAFSGGPILTMGISVVGVEDVTGKEHLYL